MPHRTARLGISVPTWLVPVLMSLAPAAQAGLGEPEASIAADAAALGAHVSASDLGTYRIHEMRAASGTLVHEYVTSAGTVFAVTWSGEHLPNLVQMLGSHYAAYMSAARAAPSAATRQHLAVHTDDLVVEMSGHMRAYRGRAYLKSAVPAGVSADALP